MKNFAVGWDAICFLISGGDPKALDAHTGIALEERRLTRGYATVLVVLLGLNFVCTGFSIYDIFIDLQTMLTLTGYLAIVVLPIALFWTLIVFSILRFLIQIGHDEPDDMWTRLRRLLTMLPAWCLLPLLGLMASAPLQVRALGDDVRLSSVMVHWNRLSTDLINIQLAEARFEVPQNDECVTPLMRPEVVVDPLASVVLVAECRRIVEADRANPERKAYSLRLLEAIDREIRDDGLITRVGFAYESAPGTSWLIALLMMCLYSSPILTRAVARKRPYEYLEYDRGRAELMVCACIELHAHEAFDRNGKAVPLHRYRGVEAEQQMMLALYESHKANLRKDLAMQSEAIKQRIQR